MEKESNSDNPDDDCWKNKEKISKPAINLLVSIGV